MALVHPEGWREFTAIGAAQREIETLTLLVGWLDACRGQAFVCEPVPMEALGWGDSQTMVL